MATFKQNTITLPSWVNDVVAGTVGGWAQVVSGTTSLTHTLPLSLSFPTSQWLLLLTLLYLLLQCQEEWKTTRKKRWSCRRIKEYDS